MSKSTILLSIGLVIVGLVSLILGLFIGNSLKKCSINTSNINMNTNNMNTSNKNIDCNNCGPTGSGLTCNTNECTFMTSPDVVVGPNNVLFPCGVTGNYLVINSVCGPLPSNVIVPPALLINKPVCIEQIFEGFPIYTTGTPRSIVDTSTRFGWKMNVNLSSNQEITLNYFIAVTIGIPTMIYTISYTFQNSLIYDSNMYLDTYITVGSQAPTLACSDTIIPLYQGISWNITNNNSISGSLDPQSLPLESFAEFIDADTGGPITYNTLNVKVNYIPYIS